MDLSFVSDSDLLKELLERYDHAGFIGMKVLTGEEGERGDHQYRRRWVGNSHVVTGLAHDLALTVLQEHNAREEGPADGT